MGETSPSAEDRPAPPDLARQNIVAPILAIVVLAIVCIVAAVMTSAQRADEVASARERQLIADTLAGRTTRIARELASVAGLAENADWLKAPLDAETARALGSRLHASFGHDFTFVVGADDRLLLATIGGRVVDPAWFNGIRASLASLIDRLHRSAATGTIGDGSASQIQRFVGRPAMVAAVAAGSGRPAKGDATVATARAPSPLLVGVKLIDEDVLADLGRSLRLDNLRLVDISAPFGANDQHEALTDAGGATIAQLAWTARRSDSEIVTSVIPFILTAIVGFVIMVMLISRYMRRTAQTIAVGESRMRHLALHDPLSGLPNRMYFSEQLEAAIDKVRNGGDCATVLCIDLDHFKEVNDTLGHPVGDELIREVTLRLRRILDGGAHVARLGGDEFAVIAPALRDLEARQALAARILAAICAPYAIQHQAIVIGASIGIAVIDDRVGTAADVMRYADMALYRAKNEGRNRACIYDAAMDADLSHRKHLEGELRIALETDGLRLAYQPLVDASGERVIGLEALSRWNHPERGEIAPSEFIPVAEHSGLINELGSWALRRACRDGLSWPGCTMAVNVSPMQFRRSDFAETVERILAETGFDPQRLELEVTESTLLGNVEVAEAAMRRLKAIGVHLALDDFGTGYSSLQYLRRFPFDKLKIDGSFVRSIDHGADAAAIIHAVVSLGRGLRMKVTAEGVETADQHLFLRAAGVHSMQGFRFGRPCPAAEISRRLDAQRNAAATTAGTRQFGFDPLTAMA